MTADGRAGSAERPAPRIAVLDYGIGNLRSAQKALQHVGAEAELTADPDLIEQADGVVLPGVGNFGACMRALVDTGLADQARKAADRGQPFLGICVGMQMLFESSAESAGVDGLGILPGRVEWLSDRVKRPQMQWNQLRCVDHPLLAGLDRSWVYFVHSLAPAPAEELVLATTDYGGPVVAAVGRANVVATQFHPEKSAAAGLRLLANFVALSSGGDRP